MLALQKLLFNLYRK